ncbi:TniB family NTP-binding protein [Tropicibacter naphthalenivorans]|uniref:Bacterial TniB protein n=1 Tax=Tropicibacter naphthalenivorans TaxID=441103 RepID=A0A0P1GKE7_9RHOB|nr:TniB family NTP-binding protein [Tropicibacter naphthalenivorans]CUH74647.1 Bacterial TniB protein [Tropicibacter naphthalenivorans]SMC50080.1 AAA domain-containing protein [Tropicibacter naphthalenivorans]
MMEIIDPILTPESTADEKALWLANRYIRLPRDAALNMRIADLFQHGPDGEMTADPLLDTLTGETHGLMVVGESGSGKSALLRRSLRMMPELQIAGPKREGNTLYVTVPPESTLRALATQIAVATGYPNIASRVKAYEAWGIARHRMRECGIRLLIIDEAHHLLRKGSGRDVEGAIQTLKSLLQGEYPVACIIAGVGKLPEAIKTDPETDRRFPQFQLPRLHDDSLDAQKFASGIAACATGVGLVLPENLDLAARILFAEGGSLGRSVRLAKTIMIGVLKEGRREIRLEDAHRAFSKQYGLLPRTPFEAIEWDALRTDLLEGGWVR